MAQGGLTSPPHLTAQYPPVIAAQQLPHLHDHGDVRVDDIGDLTLTGVAVANRHRDRNRGSPTLRHSLRLMVASCSRREW
jgi:hypothetical protein